MKKADFGRNGGVGGKEMGLNQKFVDPDGSGNSKAAQVGSNQVSLLSGKENFPPNCQIFQFYPDE